MNKITILLLSLLLVTAACNPLPEDQGVDQLITGDNPALHELDELDGEEAIPVETDIAGQFETIYIDPEQVKVIHSNMVEWPDSCLGIEQPGADCVTHPTPGYEVVLEAKGLQFAYHADEVGSQVHPATQGFKWIREGQDGGVCDQLIIYLPDTAIACWCKDGNRQHAEVNLQEILSEEEYELLIKSLTTFSENTINQPAADQPTPVMVSLAFHGQGTKFPNNEQQDSLLKMAELIFSRIAP